MTPRAAAIVFGCACVASDERCVTSQHPAVAGDVGHNDCVSLPLLDVWSAHKGDPWFDRVWPLLSSYVPPMARMLHRELAVATAVCSVILGLCIDAAFWLET